MSEQVAGRLTRRRWRWAVPGAVVAAVAAVVGLRPVVADASPSLPPRTAAQLLASLPEASTHPFSGTVRTTARLGLPDLPTSVQGQHGDLSATSLLSGTHTLRVWYAGPDRQRVSLEEGLAELTLVHDGQDLWTWSSDSRTGVHVRLPEHGAAPSAPLPPPTPQGLMRDLTPQQLARQLLSAVDPTTKVSVDGTASVAGRPAYELVVSPRQQGSLIRQIRLAVDARTSLPLRLLVLSTRSSDPAFESGFTSISYDVPPAGVFRAPDRTLKQLTLPDPSGWPEPRELWPGDARPTVVGTGWTAVLRLPGMPGLSSPSDTTTSGRTTRPNGGLTPRPQGKGDTDGGGSHPVAPPPDRTPEPVGAARVFGDQPTVPPPDGTPTPIGPSAGEGGSAAGAANQLVSALLRSSTPVRGDFGRGRLLQTALVTVLVLDDGPVFVGAVTAQVVQQAATTSARS